MKWIGQHIYDLVSRFRNDVFLEGISTSTETDILVVDSSNKISKRAASGLTSGTATLASTVTVTDSTTDTAFPVVFHDESNALLDDTGAFTYNPNTGTLIAPNLTVSGTTTTINTTNLNVEDKNIILNYHATSDTSSTADGAGITIQDAVDASNDASLTWTAADDTFEFSHAVEINNGASGGVAALIIDNDDTDKNALKIDASNVDAHVVRLDATDLTTSNAINIDCNSLTTGSAINIDVDDALTLSATKSLVLIDYDKSGATGGEQSSITTGLDISMVDAATNNASGTVTNTGINVAIDAASNQGTISQTGVAVSLTDADTGLGGNSIGFQSTVEDSIGTTFDFKAISSADANDYLALAVGGSGESWIKTVDGGAAAAHLNIIVDGIIKHTGTGGESRFYNTSLNASDYMSLVVGADGDTKLTTVDAAATAAHFEIEADGNIILDSAGTTDIESVGLIKTTGAGVEIENAALSGATALLIDNNDTDEVALKIEAANIDATALAITAANLTTGNGINVNLDSLTTGNALRLDIDSALTTNNTLDIMHIDFDKSGNVASGNTVNVYGLEIDLNDNATSNVGNTFMTGIHIGIDHANANGIAYQTGVAVSLTDGDVASTVGFSSFCEDGGVDFKAMSSADSGDYFTIATTTHGATTLTTNDDDATAAHFEIAADGNITLDAAGTIELEAATNLTGALTVGVDDTGHDVKFFGATSGKHLLWDESDDQLEFTDNTYAVFGDGDDLKIYHSSTASLVANYTGNLQIDNHATDKDILFRTDNGNAGIFTYFYLDGSSATIDGGGSTTAVYTIFPDTSRLAFGSVKDMQIWHDATDSQIQNNTGDLYIQSNVTDGDIILKGDDGSSGVTPYVTLDGGEMKVKINKPSQRTFEVSSSTDGDANGDIVYFGGTTSMTVGKIYHYKSDGTWELANADAVATADGLLGVALGAASDTNGVLLRGMVTLDHDPGAIGDVLYVQSDNAGTPGNATATAPSASGDCVRVIGYQVSHASNGNIWFNPDNTFVEVA